MSTQWILEESVFRITAWVPNPQIKSPDPYIQAVDPVEMKPFMGKFCLFSQHAQGQVWQEMPELE